MSPPAELRTEAVGPYIALLSYARAAGAPTHDAAKAIVDELITTYPSMTLLDLMPIVDARAAGLARPPLRRS